MKYFFIIPALILYLNLRYIEARVSSSECIWNLKKDIPKDDAPLYLHKDRLIIPDNGEMRLNYSQELTFLCPGSKNNVLGSDDKELKVTCSGGENLKFQSENVPLKAFVCTGNVIPSTVQNRTRCAGGKGEEISVGFETSKKFLTLVQVCFDKSHERAFYSTNVIYGKAIEHAQKSSKRPGFRTDKLTSSLPYTKQELLKRFTSSLGSAQANKYINGDSSLSRGHLAPDADFVFDSWISVTYSLINVAPEWQVVNVGNWLRVENFARDIAHIRQENLVVYTGTHGVLELPDGKGQMKKLYLKSGDKIPVPKWFWKVVYSPRSLEGIAFVTLNNPHVDYLQRGEFLCEDICKSSGWHRPEFKLYEKGFTYCCEVDELLKAVHNLEKVRVTRIMRGPK